LTKLKGEKKVLVAELRALREIGLYQGPLTRDGNEFGSSAVSTPSIPQDAERESTSDSSSRIPQEDEREAQMEMLPYQVMLLELEERKRVINSMLKADPESRSLQQLSLQLDTQSQSILQRVQTFSGAESSVTSQLISSNPLPSHEEWLQSSFQEWNSV
jgi:hypothetical protein